MNIFKIKINEHIFVFLNCHYKHSSIFSKISKKQEINNTDRSLLANDFGKSYSKYLFIDEFKTKNVHHINETIFSDDTVLNTKIKIVKYLSNYFNEHNLNTEIYLWAYENMKIDKLKLIKYIISIIFYPQSFTSFIKFATDIRYLMNIEINTLNGKNVISHFEAYYFLQNILETYNNIHFPISLDFSYKYPNKKEKPFPYNPSSYKIKPFDSLILERHYYNLLEKWNIDIVDDMIYCCVKNKNVPDFYFKACRNNMSTHMKTVDDALCEYYHYFQSNNLETYLPNMQFTKLELKLTPLVHENLPLEHIFQQFPLSTYIPYVKLLSSETGEMYKFYHKLFDRQTFITENTIDTWINLYPTKYIENCLIFVIYRDSMTRNNEPLFLNVFLYKESNFYVTSHFEDSSHVDISVINKTLIPCINEIVLFLNKFFNTTYYSLDENILQKPPSQVQMKLSFYAQYNPKFLSANVEKIKETGKSMTPCFYVKKNKETGKSMTPCFYVKKNNNKEIPLIYKRVNGFHNFGEIESFFLYSDLPREQLVPQAMKELKEKNKRVLEQILFEVDNMKANLKRSLVNYLSMKIGKARGMDYRIDFNNVENLMQLNKVKQFFVVMMHLASNNKQKSIVPIPFHEKINSNVDLDEQMNLDIDLDEEESQHNSESDTISTSDSNSLYSGGTIKHNPHKFYTILRLQNQNPALFEKYDYSSKCQSSDGRQPIGVTQNEK